MSVTRCICGNNNDESGFMIQCEKDHCGVWQHGRCIGLTKETIPEVYYCELCDPDNKIHVARRAKYGSTPARSKGKMYKKKNSLKKEVPKETEVGAPATPQAAPPPLNDAEGTRDKPKGPEGAPRVLCAGFVGEEDDEEGEGGEDFEAGDAEFGEDQTTEDKEPSTEKKKRKRKSLEDAQQGTPAGASNKRARPRSNNSAHRPSRDEREIAKLINRFERMQNQLKPLEVARSPRSQPADVNGLFVRVEKTEVEERQDKHTREEEEERSARSQRAKDRSRTRVRKETTTGAPDTYPGEGQMVDPNFAEEAAWVRRRQFPLSPMYFGRKDWILREWRESQKKNHNFAQRMASTSIPVRKRWSEGLMDAASSGDNYFSSSSVSSRSRSSGSSSSSDGSLSRCTSSSSTSSSNSSSTSSISSSSSSSSTSGSSSQNGLKDHHTRRHQHNNLTNKVSEPRNQAISSGSLTHAFSSVTHIQPNGPASSTSPAASPAAASSPPLSTLPAPPPLLLKLTTGLSRKNAAAHAARRHVENGT